MLDTSQLSTNLINRLRWRYATKKYDVSKRVSQDKLDVILEAVRLAPTSSGLQPFEVIVVTNSEIRERIKGVGYGQAQITDCSHLLVFAAWDDITPQRIDKMFDLATRERGVINEGWENYREMLKQLTKSRTKEVNFQNATKQAYIGLGIALVAAAYEEVDSTPMEGFDPEAVDEILGLTQRQLRSVVILPIGYRQADEDWLVNLKKVRRSKDEFVTEVA